MVEWPNVLLPAIWKAALAEARKPGILFPIHGLYRNGGGFATLSVADHLQSTRKYRVSVLSYDGTHRAEPRSGLNLVLPSLRGLRWLPRPARPAYRDWRRAGALARAVGAADLVVAGDPRGPTLIEAARLARRAGKPVCCVVHIDLPSYFASEDFQGDWTLAQTLDEYRRVDRIICVSRGSATAWWTRCRRRPRSCWRSRTASTWRGSTGWSTRRLRVHRSPSDRSSSASGGSITPRASTS